LPVFPARRRHRYHTAHTISLDNADLCGAAAVTSTIFVGPRFPWHCGGLLKLSAVKSARSFWQYFPTSFTWPSLIMPRGGPVAAFSRIFITLTSTIEPA